MRLRSFTAMLSTANDYSVLKWPLLLLSVLITLLAFILLLSFGSHSWFTYEAVRVNDHSGISVAFGSGSILSVKVGRQPKISDETIKYSSLLEYGSFGLWVLCTSQDTDLNTVCDTYTRQTRPHSFSVIIILTSIALILINLTIFPSWATAILVLYNVNNRYIRHIVVFMWIVFLLTLAFTCLLIGALVLIGLSKFYSPATFTLGKQQIFFYIGPGVIFMLISTILAIICLMLIIMTLIWKQFISMRLIDEEKDLLRQLSEENYRPGWHKVVMVPRGTSTVDDSLGEPPPYNNHGENTKK